MVEGLGAGGQKGLGGVRRAEPGAPLHLRMAGAILAVEIARSAGDWGKARQEASSMLESKAAWVREVLSGGQGERLEAMRQAFASGHGGDGGGWRPDALRKALWAAFEVAGVTRTRFESVGGEGVGVGPGVPILRAWDWAHPGFLDSRNPSVSGWKDGGLFGLVLNAVESRIAELTDMCFVMKPLDYRGLESQINSIVNADGCFEYLDGLKGLKEYAEFDSKRNLDVPARLQVMIDVGLALGCSGDVLLRATDALVWATSCVEADRSVRAQALLSAQARGVNPVAMNWAYRVEPVRRVMPAMKHIYRNLAAENSNYILLDIRGTGRVDIPFRIVVDRRYSDQERIEKMLAGLRRVDETPRNGYAAQVYKKREYGDKTDAYIEKNVKERAGWDPDGELGAIVVGQLPAAPGMDDLGLIVWENGGSLSSVFVPSLMIHYANYFGMADSVRVSGYRPHGRWVTFSRRGHAVAHGIGQEEPVPGFTMSDESIRKALELVRMR